MDDEEREMSDGIAMAAALSMALVAVPSLADDGHVALLMNVTGHVSILRGPSKIDAAPGMPVLISDELISDGNSSAGMTFKDGTLLTLGQSSDVKVRDYVFEPKDARYAFSVYLAKGAAIYSSGRIGKLSPQSVKVDTPTSTVGVRGTRFIVVAQ
jgi:hypothetical protein